MKSIHALIFLSALALGGAATRLHAEPSLLANGNFEASASGQFPDGWGTPPAGVSWQAENGNHFIRIESTAPGKMVMLYHQIHLKPGLRALDVKWRERVTNLQRGAKPWFDARVLFQFKDNGNKQIPNGPGPVYTQKDTSGWENREAKIIVPEGAVWFIIMPTLFQVQAGTFDIDDFTAEATDDEPLKAAAQASAAADARAFVTPEPANPAKWPQELHVDGNHLTNKSGQSVWLQGVNVCGLETLAVDKHVMRSTLVAIDQWKSNFIRVPVNESFWFGRDAMQNDGGAAYRTTVDNIVNLAANRGAYVMIDLHRFRAPTAAHVEFWKDMGAHFKNHPAVIFDLFNEPHDISWQVWRDGGFVEEKKKGVDESAFLADAEKKAANAGFQSVGMQALVDAVRSTGAKNIVVAGGLAWSGDLSGVVNGYALTDKDGNGIVYSWHNYNWHKNWAGRVLGADAKYPIIVGETGADIKKMNFIPLADQEDPYTWAPDMIGFIQKYHLNWTAWCLHPRATPVLISDWDYTPTPFWGAFVQRALGGEQFTMKNMR
jgi:hypothetical protein